MLDPLRTKRFFLAGITVGVVVMSASGLAAARLIESPGQLAARAAAPAPLAITAVASMRVLRESIMLAGTVRSGHTVAVTASAPYRAIVVTKMPVKLGTRVKPGQVIAQIDGRPVVLLEGTLPAYRDLREGDSGPDVSQLRAALGRLGYASYDPAGYFGPGTALALQSLYLDLGYSPPLARHKRRAGAGPPQVYLPMDEVSYIPAASALVVAVKAKTGTLVSSGQVVLRLATGHPYVTCMLTAHQARIARVGGAATVAAPSVPRVITGVLSRIGVIPAYSGHRGQPGYRAFVTVARPLPQTLIGSAVRLTLWSPVTSVPVLTVPEAAVHDARPTPYVIRTTAGGRSVRVPVTAGPAADGYMAVQATQPAALRPGDHVLIGTSR